jgi:hypothetical protein
MQSWVISSLANRVFVVKYVVSSMEVIDIEDMYKEYQEAKKTEIIIWCDGWAQNATKQECHCKKETFF